MCAARPNEKQLNIFTVNIFYYWLISYRVMCGRSLFFTSFSPSGQRWFFSSSKNRINFFLKHDPCPKNGNIALKNWRCSNLMGAAAPLPLNSCSYDHYDITCKPSICLLDVKHCYGATTNWKSIWINVYWVDYTDLNIWWTFPHTSVETLTHSRHGEQVRCYRDWVAEITYYWEGAHCG